MADTNLSKMEMEEQEVELRRIRKHLKDWEHAFHGRNGRSPHKHDIKSSPEICAMYRKYASLKLQQQQNEGLDFQHNKPTKTALHENEIHAQPKESSDNQFYNAGSDSQLSDDSHISATPPRKQHGASSGPSSYKSRKRPLDVVAKTLPKMVKSNSEAGRLENDSIFLAEETHNLQILRKGSKKVSLGNLERQSKKLVDPAILSSKSINDGDALLCSSGLSQLGFSIKVQRPGRHEEDFPSNRNASETVPPGFFSSCAPSSIVKPACRSILRTSSGSNQDFQPESFSHGIFSAVHAAMAVNESVKIEVIDDNKPDSFEGNKKGSTQRDDIKNHKNAVSDSSFVPSAEGLDNLSKKDYGYHTFASIRIKQTGQPFETSFGRRHSCVTGEKLDLPMPQDENTADQSLHDSVFSDKALPMSKRVKRTEKSLKGLSSWSNPSVLKKAAKKHQNMIVAPKLGSVNKTVDWSKKVSQGGNFVKLNLNGKGSRLRKFVNKGSKRKANLGGRTFYRRKRFRREDGNELLHEVGSAEILDVDENGNKKELQKESVQRHTLQSNGKAESSDKGSAEIKSNQTRRQHSCDTALLREYAENVLRDLSDQNLLKLLKISHGFDSFRSGQLETIKRIISNQSTMLVSPTGSGKSLCYQLPALVLPGVTLVVSPLVALMVDQLQHLASTISGSLLTSSQTNKEMSETLNQLCAGAIKVLFISPERFLNDNFLSTIESIPLISLVVVDEAHCLSEWSHNFRPSYFRLGNIIRKRLRVQCVLAMTATATKKTLQSILHSLEIHPSNVVQVSHMRENLQLSVSLSGNRLKDLLSLMKASPFVEAESIIIYCKFQTETDSVSKFLRDNNIPAKSYHSGLPTKDRSRTQEMFCSNKLRVVVATVAFGMGLDKSNVEAVIHYSLPGSLEHYVQETGRAGRDGRLAYCHLFLDDSTYFKMRSLAYSDGTDEYAINKFLSELFAYKDKLSRVCSLNITTASRNFDLKEEVMHTIVSYLEIEEEPYLRMLPQLNASCSVSFHKSSPTLLAKKSTLIDALLKRIQSKHGHYTFDIPTVANDTGLEISHVLKELEKLQYLGEVSYELKDPAFCYILLKVPENICSLTKLITMRLAEVEVSKVQKIDAMYTAAASAAKTSKQEENSSVCHQQSCLQRITEEYFNSENCIDSTLSKRIEVSSPFLRADIKVLLQSNAHVNFTPRAVARIMHGISSPAYPSTIWSKNHFWGRYLKVDFNVIKEAATSELVAFKGRSRNSQAMA